MKGGDEGCISILFVCVDHIRWVYVWNLLLEQLNMRRHVVDVDYTISFTTGIIVVFLSIRSDPNVVVSVVSTGIAHI